MDTETIIILAILVSLVVLPLLIVQAIFRPRPSVLDRLEQRFKEEKDSKIVSRWPEILSVPLSSTSEKARVMEEMLRSSGFFLKVRRSTGSGLSMAEVNILMRKANSFYSRAFPIRDDASQQELDRWLSNPAFNSHQGDPMLLNIASYTPIPTKTMERMLKRLLGESYHDFYRKAKEELARKDRLS